MLLRLITLFTVLPILGLVGYIIAKGAPAISWEFLTAMPSDGMRAGGIMPAIVGTRPRAPTPGGAGQESNAARPSARPATARGAKP